MYNVNGEIDRLLEMPLPSGERQVPTTKRDFKKLNDLLALAILATCAFVALGILLTLLYMQYSPDYAK